MIAVHEQFERPAGLWVPRTASRPLISASRLAVLSITPPGVSGEAASLLFELGQLDDRHELACLDLLGHSPDHPF